MVVGSFVLACLALVVSGVSVAVSIVLWQRSGPRISVAWAWAFPVFGSNLGDQHVSVCATNNGRAPATVTGWGFVIEGTDSTIVDLSPPGWLPRLPYRLEAHASATWFMDRVRLHAAAVGEDKLDRGLWPFVTLGTGQRVLSKKPIEPHQLEVR